MKFADFSEEKIPNLTTSLVAKKIHACNMLQFQKADCIKDLTCVKFWTAFWFSFLIRQNIALYFCFWEKFIANEQIYFPISLMLTSGVVFSKSF